jgi:hypothetical protein
LKAYPVELTEPVIPKRGQVEDPTMYLPTPTHVMHMTMYNNPKKRSGRIKALKMELKIIIYSGKNSLLNAYLVELTEPLNPKCGQ